MIWKSVTAAFILCSSTAIPANAAGPIGLKGKPYDQGRAILVRRGYRPVHFQRGPLFNPCPDDPSSCKPYPEAIGCSGTGFAYCQFAFFSAVRSHYIIVTTRGEERRTIDSVVIASRRDRMGWPPQVR